MKRLNFSEKSELISKLLACQAIKVRNTREVILRQLREEISHRISYDERDDVHITNTVDACLNYTQGLEELIDIIYYYERASQPMCELDELVNKLFPAAIGHTQLREFKNLIKEINWPTNVLDSAYRASMPLGEKWLFPLNNDDAEKPFEMLKTLADAPIRGDGTVPLFIFVKLLIKYLESRSPFEKLNPKSHAKRLRRWIEITAKEHGLRNVPIDEKLLTPSPMPDSLSYLLVAIKQDDYEPQEFTMQAWLLNSEYKSMVQLYAEDEHRQRSVKEMAEIFDHLLAEGRRYLNWKAAKSLIIEFSLPSSMICCNVDHWIVKIGQYVSVQVGIEHQVLVRSYERAHNQVFWDPWKALWEQYQNSTNNRDESVPPFLICGLQEDEEQANFYARLRRHSFACLALTHTPSEETIHTMLDFGIPIAIWSRENVYHTDHMQEAFTSLLSSCRPPDLPVIIWKQRMEAFDKTNTDGKHLGRNLTLLWDDPHRLPPDIQNIEVPLEAPRKGQKL